MTKSDNESKLKLVVSISPKKERQKMKAIKQFLGLTFVAVSLIPFFTKEEVIIYFLAGILGGIGLVIAEE